ncbi:MAG: hypothetical protein R3300_05255 [Candidatus Promineifilaceae bacterium]|nr:hypothetical protein [Candidatus Promineifilaceae bacterium]
MEDTLRDRIALQRILIDMQLTIECELTADRVFFLDRALPCLSFSRFVGLDPNEILSGCFHHRYASVSILDSLPFLEEGKRDGDAALGKQSG